MDRHHVLRPGCPLFLGLGLLCPPHCGELLKINTPFLKRNGGERDPKLYPASSFHFGPNDDDAGGQ